jgi:hypothetical protein
MKKFPLVAAIVLSVIAWVAVALGTGETGVRATRAGVSNRVLKARSMRVAFGLTL